ncbi:MAG: MJ1477/TM1410 family putative glycoside hydrolase [Planctomycetota bacterium]
MTGARTTGTAVFLVVASLVVVACSRDGSDGNTLAGDEARNLSRAPQSDDQNPAFSPNGQNLIFSSTRNARAAEPQQSEEFLLPLTRTPLQAVSHQQSALSPEAPTGRAQDRSTTLSSSSLQNAEKSRRKNLNIWRMKATGDSPVPLTNDLDADNVNMPGSSWSLAAGMICFSSDRSGNDEVWIMTPEGSERRRITDNAARDWEPTFSPDGKWLVFQSDRAGNWEIYKARTSAAETVRLTDHPASDTQPNWSPTGESIVFQSLRDGNWEIYTMDTGGANLRNVSNDPGEDTDPSWSADGRRIVYSSDRDAQEEADLYVIEATGTRPPVRVTRDPAYDGAPSFSPDGTMIAFESDRSGDLEIWTLPAPSPAPDWSAIDDFAYQLQELDLEALGESAFDLAIIDYSRDGGDELAFSSEEIATLRASPGGGKRVLAYMSIGEAEDYRWYWSTKWDADHDGMPDPGAPSWLGPSNPDWPGNYKVRYWETGWQELIYGSPSSYLDKILAAGFDGVYLDIVDAYEYWGPGGESGLGRDSAEADMVRFVIAIAEYARTRREGFAVFPQNGEGLATHADYVDTVTGIGREDTWYDGNVPQPDDHTAQVLEDLELFRQAGKLVLVVDYVTRGDLIDAFYAAALAHGFIPYATVRDLDRLTVNAGHEPD